MACRLLYPGPMADLRRASTAGSTQGHGGQAQRLLPLVVLFALLGFPSSLRSETWEEVQAAEPHGLLEVEFDLGEGLRPDPGSLVITSHSSPEVRMEVEADGWSSWDLVPRLERKPGRLHAEVRVTGATAWMFGGPNVRVRIFVPAETSLEIRAAGGPVRIENVAGSVRGRVRDGALEIRGIGGDVKLRVQQGDVEIDELAGKLDVSVTDGAIRASRIAGDVEARGTDGAIRLDHVDGAVVAKTLHGDVEVTQVRGPVEARTEHGDIQIAFSAAPEGTVSAEDGDLDIEVPIDAGFDLDADATRGELIVAPALLPAGAPKSPEARTAIAGGGKRLVLRSSEGRIRVHGR